MSKAMVMSAAVVSALSFSALTQAAPPSAAACVAAHRAVTAQHVVEEAAPNVATDRVLVDDSASAPPATKPPADDAAAVVFTQCATRVFGPAATPRAAACEADLYTLPVLLLYRADGQTRAQAQADLKRPGNEETSPAAARRTADMLAFVYQGKGPASEGASAWIAKRTDEWTSACLRGQR